jgi:hypothetical protein
VRAAWLREGPRRRHVWLPKDCESRAGRCSAFPALASIRSVGRFGAEYGSDTHRQFGPRRESGYWLNPAAERVNDAVGNEWLDDVLDAAFERFG